MLEVFEIYQPPQADRNKIAGKMLGHILIVFAALAVVMVKLFSASGQILHGTVMQSAR